MHHCRGGQESGSGRKGQLVCASIPELIKPLSPGGEIGRRKGLKIPRLYGRAGSIPAPGTIYFLIMNSQHLKEIKIILKKIHRTLVYVFLIVGFFAVLYFGLLIYLFYN